MSEIVIQPTKDHLVRMMDYLGVHSFVVPDHNMELPECLNGYLFRSERIFRILRADLRVYPEPVMTYWGIGFDARGERREVYKSEVPMSQGWVDRAFIFLSEDVKNKIRMRANGCGMKNAKQLALKFNKLEFLSFGERDI